MNGRRKPYTALGIARLRCWRCGSKAASQWQTCADGNLYRAICLKCDIALNALVLKFMLDPERKEKMSAYRRSKG